MEPSPRRSPRRAAIYGGDVACGLDVYTFASPRRSFSDAALEGALGVAHLAPIGEDALLDERVTADVSHVAHLPGIAESDGKGEDEEEDEDASESAEDDGDAKRGSDDEETENGGDEAAAATVAKSAPSPFSSPGAVSVHKPLLHEAAAAAAAADVAARDATRRGSLAFLLAQPFEPTPGGIRLADLRPVATVGVGTFGRVMLVRHAVSGDVYALKVLRKKKLARQSQEANVVYERAVLAAVRHPFLLRLHATFQDEHKLYLLTEYVSGGELFALLGERHCLTSSHARFYAGCVVLGLAHLHKLHIAYRDLKPENLLIDRLGYIRIVDFGFAKHIKPSERTFTVCGTPEYLAPEVLSGRGYGLGVDWWSLGVLIYEMLTGVSPFAAAAREGGNLAVFKAILGGPPVRAFPRGCHVQQGAGAELSIVQRLMDRDVVARLGCGREGAAEVMAHPWFSGEPVPDAPSAATAAAPSAKAVSPVALVGARGAPALDWAGLEAKSLPAPWLPAVSSAADTRYFDRYDDSESDREGGAGSSSCGGSSKASPFTAAAATAAALKGAGGVGASPPQAAASASGSQRVNHSLGHWFEHF